jgi:hypothetical protein
MTQVVTHKGERLLIARQEELADLLQCPPAHVRDRLDRAAHLGVLVTEDDDRRTIRVKLRDGRRVRAYAFRVIPADRVGGPNSANVRMSLKVREYDLRQAGNRRASSWVERPLPGAHPTK